VHVNIKALPQSREIRLLKRGKSRGSLAYSTSNETPNEGLRGVPQVVAREGDSIHRRMNK
jgi:hypothetical protein